VKKYNKVIKMFQSLEVLSLEQRMDMFDSLIAKAHLDSKSFQRDGLKWCLERELSSDDVKGGIVADEMGLGKTILMIGLIYSHFVRRTLVVLPVALLKQWQQAILKITGHEALIYYGKERKKITKDQLRSARIVLTTYNIVTLCAYDKASLLHTTRWSRIIYDEAHHLRNAATTRHIGCGSLTAKINWVVSGTPIQNRIADLKSLCSVIGVKIVATDLKTPEIRNAFLRKYVLKRTKLQVGIDLPPLNIETVTVPWSNRTEQHMAIDIHHSLGFSNVKCNKRSAMKMAFAKQIPLILLMRARQACVMPILMKNQLFSMHEEGEAKFNETHINAIKANSKINAVVNMVIDRKDNGTGKLIFCHYTKEIDEIKMRLLAGGLKKVVTYDGRTGKNTNILTEPADALILQIQTGCEGLNLQEHYSEIYFVSPHWNPAVEDQAIARCYRIGQKKPVNVYKYIMDNFDNETKSDEKQEKIILNTNDTEIIVDVDLESDKTLTIENYVNIVQGRKRQLIADMLQTQVEDKALTSN